MTALSPELSKEDILLNEAMGLCKESGEVIDMLKKHPHQGYPLDSNLVTVFKMNIEKLQERYPQVFTEECSLNHDHPPSRWFIVGTQTCRVPTVH